MNIPNRDNIKTIAAVHQQDTSCRVVVASLRAGGDIDIKGAESIHLGAGPAMFTSLIERVGGVDAVVRVLPSGCTMARITGLPDKGEGASSPSAVADALALIAETELPGSVPEYRRAAGLVNPGRASGRRPMGLLTCWPPSAELTGARTPRVGPEVGISEAAALAVLAQLVGGVDRAWTVDRSAGAMTILAAGPEKTVVRVARIPAGDAAGESRRSAIAETTRAAALSLPSEAPIGDSWLTLEPAPVSPRIAGQPRSPQWLAEYGLAAAAAIAFADSNPAVSGLVALHEVEPKQKPPILQRISTWVGVPHRAAALIALCVLVVIAVPIGVSYAKVRILKKQVPDEKQIIAENEQGEKELAFYQLLREKRWPMTKLLADIAACCPQGITIESVEVGQGEGVNIRGLADDTGKLTTFRANLNGTKVFTDAATPSTNPGASGVQFSLTAKVTAPVYTAKPLQDWADKTLAEVMYGEKAAPKNRPATTRAEGTTRDRPDRRNQPSGSRPSATSSRDKNSRSDRPSPSASAAPSKNTPAVVPPPISDSDIAKLSHDAAMKEWTSRKAAAAASTDEAVKRRLMDESEKAKARMQEAGQGGGK